MPKKIGFVTIVARNYLAQAFVLGDSVKKYHPYSDFIIFLMDDIDHEFEQDIRERGFSVLYPEQTGIKDFKKLVFNYSILEACTAVKPSILLHLLEQGADKMIYLDPDIMCCRALNEAIQALDSFTIVITPHSLSPVDAGTFSDQLFLTHGAYNLGFLGIARGEETNRFLRWWEAILSTKCLIDYQNNLFVDQKWFDLVPAYFDKVCILRSPAYNIAYWNAHERTLRIIQGKYHVEQSGEAVAFIHFSGMHVYDLVGISEDLSEGSKHSATADYTQMLLANGYFKYSKIKYGYATYSNGELISPFERTLYLNYFNIIRHQSDPFVADKRSFWGICKKLRLNSVSFPSDLSLQNRRPNDAGGCFQKSVIKQLINWMTHIIIATTGIRNARRLSNVMIQEMKVVEHDIITRKLKKFS